MYTIIQYNSGTFYLIKKIYTLKFVICLQEISK